MSSGCPCVAGGAGATVWGNKYVGKNLPRIHLILEIEQTQDSSQDPPLANEETEAQRGGAPVFFWLPPCHHPAPSWRGVARLEDFTVVLSGPQHPVEHKAPPPHWSLSLQCLQSAVSKPREERARSARCLRGLLSLSDLTQQITWPTLRLPQRAGVASQRPPPTPLHGDKPTALFHPSLLPWPVCSSPLPQRSEGPALRSVLSHTLSRVTTSVTPISQITKLRPGEVTEHTCGPTASKPLSRAWNRVHPSVEPMFFSIHHRAL